MYVEYFHNKYKLIIIFTVLMCGVILSQTGFQPQHLVAGLMVIHSSVVWAGGPVQFPLLHHPTRKKPYRTDLFYRRHPGGPVHVHFTFGSSYGPCLGVMESDIWLLLSITITKLHLFIQFTSSPRSSFHIANNHFVLLKTLYP
jgi:hypothetical protein